MKKLALMMCFINYANVSFALTIVDGEKAQSVYQAMPTAPVLHTTPRIFNVKILARNFNCAERFEKDNELSYICLLPSRNNLLEIELGEELSKDIYILLNVEPIRSQDLGTWTKYSGPIKCDKSVSENEKDVYKCIVDI